jgi:hypothetical protein
MAAAAGTGVDRWSAHPGYARAIRVLVYAAPVALSLGIVRLVISWAQAPTGSLWMFLAWWLAVSLVATAVVSLAYALTRRLLPLGALLQLSLVFPDQAPSRFQLALSTGTVESLIERLEALRGEPGAASTQEAAQILVRLAAALSVHDSITRGHAERVRAYSALLGTQLRLSKDELEKLNWAALLHDVGKLGVSREILNKPSAPTDEEWEALRQHPELGARLVEPLRGWLGGWLDAVGQHHERWDGKGYPLRLAGEAISPAARIVAIADAFDVMTSRRTYKDSESHHEARAELVRCAGAHFDPGYVRAFVEVSLTRMRLVLGPLSWLTHAPLLARIPLTQSVGAALSGVATVAAVTATTMSGPADARSVVPLHERAPVVESAPRPRHTTPAVKPHVEPRVPVRVPRRPTAPPQGTVPDSTPAAPPSDTTPKPEEPSSKAPDPAEPPAHQTPDPPAPGSPSVPAPAPTPPPVQVPAPTPPPLPPPPNRPPTFAAGADQTVLEDAGDQSVAWATAVSAGTASESGQAVTFNVSVSDQGLFAAQPAMSSSGTLTYTPAPDAFGSSTVTVVARDDGGTANGGDDTSGSASFTITVESVNDAPRFNAGGNQVVVSLLGARTVSGWASAISPGPANESSQYVSFVVTTSNPNMFLVQPTVSADGSLTYRPKPFALGTATVTVRAVDDGGTANGGVDASASQSCSIVVV